LIWSWHVPLLLHGWLKHSSISITRTIYHDLFTFSDIYETKIQNYLIGKQIECGVICTNDPDIDECGSFPCQHNGTCTDLIDRYTCQCQPGYKGYSCEIGKTNM
jgi:hypothetical protein